MDYKVKFEHVTKKYKMYNKPSDKLKDLFFKRQEGDYHYALNNISFEVPEGEIIGIIGLNGSGKSTMSNLIAGVTIPNKGKINIKGSAALIAIASGLNNQLTGIENIELKGLMMGLTKEQIQDITPKVIEFADIGKFMYQPVKTYSSGMKSRIGFAISVHINPDVLVIDEALSVGDQTFTKKCLDKMNEFKEQGKTIFFISHSLSQVKSFCTKAIWLHYGQMKEYGDVNEVVDHYSMFLKQYNQMNIEEKRQLREEQTLQFQHGLLQEQLVKTPRRNYKAKKQQRKLSKKSSILVGTAIVILTGIITIGLNYKAFASLIRGNENKEKMVQSKIIPEDKSAKESPSNNKKYMVNSNNISIRREPITSSERLVLTNFGEVFTVPNFKEKNETNNGWIQIVLANGESGWLSAEYAVPFTPSKSTMDDTKLDDVISLLNRVYGLALKQAPTYFGKTLDELKAVYPRNLIPLQTVVGKTSYKDGNVKFVISETKVIEIVFQDISMSIAKLHELLGKESINNDSEKNYFFETKSYYIAARSDETHQEIQSLSIMIKK
ncbi:teichoic acids export ABC transporter ATP-binding subunit TagH [Bacillus gaemokensis]|uniref:Teichoic acids export protein ATP-binding subunit n=1 Tax=Bacillus gaemokensis TaxID=574375 RepID=A0A073KSW6_9BACI|nr:teichoic acids export ABC transporter ATP-binding subunit TagH [Bacillus gaemokensis]KEK25448.1 teichoic acids export protein ATP-binding subunit [Bacillus gaemokensis]KYG37106.1 teichoic acid export protein ATP-binding subunit [Bacillus gaemokensis]